jgi:dTMP kinase
MLRFDAIMTPMPLFITFEGIEGCGKTTQVALLADRLRRQGLEVVTTREPGGCPIADAVRGILLHPGNTALVPRAELLLYAAARAQHVAEVIRPALQRGEIVLCDRYLDATVAYQGFGRGLDLALIDELNLVAADGLFPDLTLLFDLPPEEGLSRATRRNATATVSEDRFERESLAFHRRVREGYLHLARTHARFRLVDATGSIEEVGNRLEEVVRPVLAGSRGR